MSLRTMRNASKEVNCSGTTKLTRVYYWPRWLGERSLVELPKAKNCLHQPVFLNPAAIPLIEM